MTTALQPTFPGVVPGPEVESPPGVPRPYRLTIDKYNQMVEAGIFGPQDRLFLWEGQLVESMTKKPPHSSRLTKLYRFLDRLVHDGWVVRQEQPLELPDHSEPEPDLVIVRGTLDDFEDRHPNPQDVGMIAEVSDSSLAFDRGEKLRSYAAHAVPVYWIVSIPERRIEVYTDPTGPADPPNYGHVQVYNDADEVPVVLDGREVGRLPAREVLS